MTRALAVAATAAIGLLAVIGPGIAGGASTLSVSDARYKAQKYIRKNHCPTVCFSSVVPKCKRDSDRRVLCKGRTHYPTPSTADSSDKWCKGNVRVVKRGGGRVATKSFGWSCRKRG